MSMRDDGWAISMNDSSDALWYREDRSEFVFIKYVADLDARQMIISDDAHGMKYNKHLARKAKQIY